MDAPAHIPSIPPSHTHRARINLAGVVVLLSLALFTGGSSQQSGIGVLLLQLAALPCLAWVAWQHLNQYTPAWPWPWKALAITLLAIPLLQLIPLPDSLAAMGEARTLLHTDLTAFGAPAATQATLDAHATRGALHLLLPALAVFGLTAVLPAAQRRQLAWTIIGLAMASLLLGILQLGAPQESALNPYPQWRPAMNGFFANPNHQATLLVLAGVLAAGWLATGMVRPERRQGSRIPGLVAAAAVLVLAMGALPLTGSRAGVILFVIAVTATVAAHASLLQRARPRRALLAASAGVAGLGVFAAMRWMQVEAVRELRGPMREATLEVAGAHAPLGSGMGSFVPVFEQATAHQLLMPSYVNHAHNEYAQWLLEAGWLALPAMALGAWALISAGRALLRLPPPARSAGLCALIGLLAVLGHSFVDYPLRTPALLLVAAALAGLVLATVQDGNAIAVTEKWHNSQLGSGQISPAAATATGDN